MPTFSEDVVCDEADLRRRIKARSGGHAAAARIDPHLALNRRIRSVAADGTLEVTLLDASRPADEVEPTSERGPSASPPDRT